MPKPILDLNHYHFRRASGQITVFGSWYGKRNGPCLVLMPTYLIGQPDLNPIILPLACVWAYSEDNADEPWMRDRLETYALMLRMNPHSRNDRMQIMRAIAASYADLLTMPPRGTDGKRVVAEGQRTNIETGETTTGEIEDFV